MKSSLDGSTVSDTPPQSSLASSWIAFFRRHAFLILVGLFFGVIPYLWGVPPSQVWAVLWGYWAMRSIVIVGVLRYLVIIANTPSSNYRGIPLICEAEGDESFSLGTRLAYYTNSQALFREAYEKYSKHGKTCLVPGLGFRNEVILPVGSLRWITSQGDHILSGAEAVIDMAAWDWTTGHRKYFIDPWHGMVFKRDMNAVLENLAVALNDELQFCLKEALGTNTDDWTEINTYKTMQIVIAQGSSRFTVGLPLCRDRNYLLHNIKMGNLYVNIGSILGIMPPLLRQLAGPIFVLPNRFYQWKINQALMPLFMERMEYLKFPPKTNLIEPQDHFQMNLRFAQKERPHELNLHDIGVRTVNGNFGSFHQTGIAATNLLLNVLESDKEYNTISLLRSEISQVLKESSNNWTRAAVAKMVRCDSVLRETLRLHAFTARNMLRKVMVNDVTTQDGILLPKGANVSMLSLSIQSDADNFDNPFKFDPFRYSRVREAHEAAECIKDEETKMPNVSFVSTGPQFLPFGHGKHACPGRFLVDFELKMVLAYVLLNYDLEFPKEYEGKRPPGAWMAEVLMPPANAKIRVRRRAENKA